MRYYEIISEFNVNAFHGTNQDISAFEFKKNEKGKSGSREGPLGFWFTDNADTASHFAHWAGRGLGGENIIPVKLKLNNPLIVQKYDDIRDIVDKFTTFEKPDYINGGRQIRMMGDKVDYDAARKWLKSQGYDGILLQNTHTDAPDDNTKINQYVVFDASQIRSRFANFNPDKADSNVLTDSRKTFK